MTDHPIHELDDDVHQRVRLGILAALTGLTRADFAHLKRELALTDGNLGRHLEVLGEAGFVKLTRDAAGRSAPHLGLDHGRRQEGTSQGSQRSAKDHVADRRCGL